MKSSQLHVIVGLGKTGLSCAHFLSKRGIPFAVTDTRLTPPQLADLQKAYPDVPVELGGLSPTLLNQADIIILSPGVALREPLISKQIKRGVPVIGDIELFATEVNVPVIAITGTNAKSTVTTLVGKMIQEAGYKVAIGGNLGVPALDLLESNTHTEVFVLELSSFQLETTFSLKPSVASVLNITPDHMDRYDTLLEYSQAKHRIFKNCKIAVCNRDDALTYYTGSTEQTLYFTLNSPRKNEFGVVEQSAGTYLAFEQTPLLNVEELLVKGKHYQANALAALAIGHGFGLPFTAMQNVLKEFVGLDHRCQFVREYANVCWYNDSKGTNVGATKAAIEGLGSEIKGKLILIAGGVGKNADFSPLVPVIEKYVRHVVLIGNAAKELATMLMDHVPCSHASSMDEAVQLASSVAKPHDNVLLSPACASFDMFRHYEHRGEVFMESVKKLGDIC